jgi:hypothetical protein
VAAGSGWQLISACWTHGSSTAACETAGWCLTPNSLKHGTQSIIQPFISEQPIIFMRGCVTRRPFTIKTACTTQVEHRFRKGKGFQALRGTCPETAQTCVVLVFSCRPSWRMSCKRL